MSSAAELRDQYGARRSQAMAQMANLALARNQEARTQQVKYEQAVALAQKQANDAVNEQGRSWLGSAGGMAMSGAGVGTMIGGPGWGTAIGAIAGGGAGLLAGVANSYKNRRNTGPQRSRGRDLLGAINPMGDNFSMSDVPLVGGMAPQPGTINNPQLQAKNAQDKALQDWRNKQASHGMTGSTSSASVPMAPGMGQAYGAAYSQPAAPAAPPMVGPRAYAYNPVYDTNDYWNQ